MRPGKILPLGSYQHVPGRRELLIPPLGAHFFENLFPSPTERERGNYASTIQLLPLFCLP